MDFWFCRTPRRRGDAGEALFIEACELIGSIRRANQCAQRADHRQNARYIALVEDVDGEAGADEVSDDAGLQVGEGENQIRLERENLWNVRRDEGRYPRLFAADSWRPYRIAGDADDAILLAEQIQRLHGLFGEADDPAGREMAHAKAMRNNRRGVTRQRDQRVRSAPGRSGGCSAISRIAASMRRRSR